MHRWSFCFVHEHSDEGPLGNATRSRRLPRVPAHVSSTPPASSAARRCEDADPRRGRREGHGHRRRRTTPRGGRYLAGGRSRGSLVTNARERVKPTRSCRRRTARGQPDEHRLPHSPAAGCPPAKRAAPARSALPAHQCPSLRARRLSRATTSATPRARAQWFRRSRLPSISAERWARGVARTHVRRIPARSACRVRWAGALLWAAPRGERGGRLRRVLRCRP